MKTSDFDYDLPPALIAQSPTAIRDRCRLLALKRKDGTCTDSVFCDIGKFLARGDLLVANETRVMPARLIGRKRTGKGAAEIFLLRKAEGLPQSEKTAYWEALVRPGKRLKPTGNAIVDITDADGNTVMTAEVVDWADARRSCDRKMSQEKQPRPRSGPKAPDRLENAAGQAPRGERIVRLSTTLASVDEALHAAGTTPLPPYIKNYAGDTELYQTVYAKRESSSAAPTAGLHFTSELIASLQKSGIGWQTVELEVGLDTFRTVEEEDIEDHAIHTEFYHISPQTARAVKQTKAQGGRVVAVGTTAVRALESAWEAGEVRPHLRKATSLYIVPGYEFHVVDALITNFHMPKSTLMMLVSAFAGHENIMGAYRHAIEEGFRFLSFGDAMLIY